MERSDDFVTVGYFLATCGEGTAPPIELHCDQWKQAYAAFYEALGTGRSLTSFSNSLKATRDAFDAWVDSDRIGWRDPNDPAKPKPLQPIEERVMLRWLHSGREELWAHARTFSDLRVAAAPSTVLGDLDTQSAEVPDGNSATEGGRKVRLRAEAERSPGLRARALSIHGYACMVCGFDFGEVYGEWGRQYAEVHHVEPLGTDPDRVREVDPKVDLVVVCANCHRMLHRRRTVVLDLHELRAKLDRSALRAWLGRLGR